MIRKGLPIETADLSRKDELNCAEAAIFHQLREREREREQLSPQMATKVHLRGQQQRSRPTPTTHQPFFQFYYLLIIRRFLF